MEKSVSDEIYRPLKPFFERLIINNKQTINYWLIKKQILSHPFICQIFLMLEDNNFLTPLLTKIDIQTPN